MAKPIMKVAPVGINGSLVTDAGKWMGCEFPEAVNFCQFSVSNSTAVPSILSGWLLPPFMVGGYSCLEKVGLPSLPLRS